MVKLILDFLSEEIFKVTVKKDNMQISILASGSSGNTTYIETPQRKILVDAGLSGVRIERLMNSIGKTLKDVDSILVSHEHVDHVQGVGVLARRYGMDIYANQKTWDAMAKRIGKIDNAQKYLFEPGQTLSLGDIDIESFNVSHDAANPQFYQVHHNNKAFAIVTDTGYIDDKVAGIIQDADAYLFECNHDIDMLRVGPYPWALKQRILGEKGHLSNEDGAQALMDVLGNRTKKIYLGHLSQENNVKELAHLTVEQLMAANDFAVGSDFEIMDTDPKEATSILTL